MRRYTGCDYSLEWTTGLNYWNGLLHGPLNHAKIKLKIVFAHAHSKQIRASSLTHHNKKEKVTLTLLRLSQLQPNDTMSLPIELPFLLYLIACVQCAGCPQSITRVMFPIILYGRNLTCDG